MKNQSKVLEPSLFCLELPRWAHLALKWACGFGHAEPVASFAARLFCRADAILGPGPVVHTQNWVGRNLSSLLQSPQILQRKLQCFGTNEKVENSGSSHNRVSVNPRCVDTSPTPIVERETQLHACMVQTVHVVTYKIHAASNSSSCIFNAHLNVFLELELNWLLLLLFVQPIKKQKANKQKR